TRTRKLGPCMQAGTDMGPLVSARAQARVEEQVARARREGAQIVAGGCRVPEAGAGYFFAPTLMTGVTPDSALVCEEVFGPIASIQVVTDADEAIAMAARSEYGLGANIYTSNLTWAMQAMTDIKAGT